jgi:nitrate reductase gamma subunit
MLLNTFQADSLVTWLVLGALLITAITVYTVINAKLVLNDSYAVREPAKTNFAGVLGGMMVAAAGIAYLLVTGLEAQWGMLNSLMFAAFPYVCFTIFIIGSIYRYMNRGFQVSSLSSEFLERKKLFWGSQPFHWGLLVIFFGHLIAFLFPSSVLAWNGEPVRLLILEVSSFAFALSALAGLLLLIKRRLENPRILIVSNKMDMLVYTVLITQIVTGLGVAFFVRWGSSWFAAVLTPYLRSIFALNPDIAAVSAMPWLVQLHIISAFFMIAIIPFTRFVHFLVAPVDYLWRGYQLVIWNWNHKTIRKPGSYFPGFKSKNN